MAIRIDIPLPGHHHSGNRGQDRNIGSQKSHASYLPDKNTRAMVIKDLAMNRCNLPSTFDHCSIESNDIAVIGEQLGDGTSATAIPAIQQLPVERTNLSLIYPSRVLC